jgi:hypothetical protein
MEDGAAFVEPAGLGIDEVGEGAAGERGRAVGYSFRVEVVNSGGAFGVEKGSFSGDLYGGAQGGDA